MKEFYQLELLNREKNYNHIFNADPIIATNNLKQQPQSNQENNGAVNTTQSSLPKVKKSLALTK